MERKTPPRVDRKRKADELPKSIEKSIQDIIASRKAKKEEKRLDAVAMTLLREAGVDHNKVFQKVHCGQAAGGHWTSFKRAIVGLEEVTCKICQDLMLVHSIKVQEYDAACAEAIAARGAADSQKFEEEAGEDPGNTMAMVPFDSECPPLQPPPKRGRPRKNEDMEQRFNLIDFISTNRPDIYHFLTPDEAVELLPEQSRQNALLVSREMKKNPVRCNVCNIVLHFRYLTNRRALSVFTFCNFKYFYSKLL